MQQPDSLARIVSYFHALAREPFSSPFGDRRPYSRLVVSEKVFRSYSCPPQCGACCMRCSLVWRHRSEAPSDAITAARAVKINNVTLDFIVDEQAGHDGRFCSHLDGEGRCGIYASRPLPCRLELFKFVHTSDHSVARAMVRLPGRGFTLTRVTGERGAQCQILPYDDALTQTHIRDLLILHKWMEEFGIENDCEGVIRYLSTGPHSQPLEIKRRRGLL